MSFFNVNKPKNSQNTQTKNAAGGPAWAASPKLELLLVASSCMFGSRNDQINEEKKQQISSLVQKCGQVYSLKVANYVRNHLGLRTVSIFILAEASKAPKQPGAESAVRQYVPKVVRRADEPAELLSAIWEGASRSKTPMAVLRGLKDTLPRWNAYQLRKYQGTGKGVSLRDVFRLVRPKPKDKDQAELYRQAAKGELPLANTWETRVSGEGSTKETWDSVAPEMGLLALIRNIQNFEKVGSTIGIECVVRELENAEKVMKSGILPFQFLKASNFSNNREVKRALEAAMTYSTSAMPELPGKTGVYLDVSGSMGSTLYSRRRMFSRQNSNVRELTAREAGALLMAMMVNRVDPQNIETGLFDDKFTLINIDRAAGVHKNYLNIVGARHGGATYTHKIFEDLIKRKKFLDRVIVFSDMNNYDDVYGKKGQMKSLIEQYRKEVNPEVQVIFFDLTDDGTLSMPERSMNVMSIGGFSEKVLGWIGELRNSSEVVQDIEANW